MEVKLATHLHLVMRLMSGSTPLLPHSHFHGTDRDEFVRVLVISQAIRSGDGIGVVSAWQLLLQSGVLLDSKGSGMFFPTQQSWNEQVEDLKLNRVTVCQQIMFYHHVQQILLLFLVNKICVQFERKRFLSTE
jgi:hypothetical protein